MKTDKESGAIRLMEALSAASEELLERSEKAGAVKSSKKNTGTRFFVQKYAKACAACICLAVLGAAYFGVSHMRMGSAGEAGMKSGGAGDDYNNEGRIEEMMSEGVANQEPELADDGGTVFDGAASAFAEPEWLDVDGLEAMAEADGLASGKAESGGTEEVRQEAETLPQENHSKENASSGAAEGSEPEAAVEKAPSLEDALTVEALTAVAAVPAGYGLIKAEGGLYCEWSDGEHSLWLKLTRTELTTDLRFCAEPPVYTVEEEWEELIPPADGNEYLQFALLYENGILAEYCGALEREEIIILMESLSEIRLP